MSVPAFGLKLEVLAHEVPEVAAEQMLENWPLGAKFLELQILPVTVPE